MRSKEADIKAILKRTKEILENTEYLTEFEIVISGGAGRFPTINYNIDEAVVVKNEAKPKCSHFERCRVVEKSGHCLLEDNKECLGYCEEVE